MADAKKVSVLALAAFVLAGQRYMPGQVKVPADAVPRLRDKGLIEAGDDMPDGEANGQTNDDTPAALVLHMLKQQIDPDVDGEDEAAALARIIRERDEATAEVERLTSAAPQTLSILKPIGAAGLGALLMADLDTPDKVRATSDEKLLGLNGIAEGRLAEIREILGD